MYVFNKKNIIKNCYYLSDSETDEIDGITFKTVTQVGSGEEAYQIFKD